MTLDMTAARSTRLGDESGDRKNKPSIVANDNRVTLPPKVAIIGAGLMGRWHLFSARKAGARVIAVVDPEPDAARRLAARAHGARPLADIDALLTGERPVAAHICAPSQHHFGLARSLIAAGVHVFVEKPLCQLPEEARALTAQARQKNVVICPVHQYAFQRGVECALRWMPDLGRIRRVSFDICSAGADRLPAARRMTVIDEILPHPLSILQRLGTAPLSDVAWTVAADPEGEYFASASPNGAIVTISISLNARPTCFFTRIEADQGTIEIDGFHGFATLARGRTSRFSKIAGPFARSSGILGKAALNLVKRAIQDEPAYPGLSSLTRLFYAAVTNGALPIPPEHINENVEVWSRLRVDAHISNRSSP